MSNVITLHLGRPYESVELYLHLPAAPDEIDQKLTDLDDYAEDLSKPVEIRDVECEIVGIRQYLRTADLSREGEMEKLNALAGKIEGMDDRQRNLLWGALDSESVNDFDDVVRISEHLDDYVLLLGSCNTPENFFYCDPPYHESEGFYKNIGAGGFTLDDHLRLRDTLLGREFKGRFLLSYNDDGFVRDLYNHNGIYLLELTRLHNMKQRFEKGAQFPELLIANYDIHDPSQLASAQISLF